MVDKNAPARAKKKTTAPRKRKKTTKRAMKAKGARRKEASKVTATADSETLVAEAKQLDVSEVARAASVATGQSRAARRRTAAPSGTRRKKVAKKGTGRGRPARRGAATDEPLSPPTTAGPPAPPLQEPRPQAASGVKPTKTPAPGPVAKVEAPEKRPPAKRGAGRPGARRRAGRRRSERPRQPGSAPKPDATATKAAAKAPPAARAVETEAKHPTPPTETAKPTGRAELDGAAEPAGTTTRTREAKRRPSRAARSPARPRGRGKRKERPTPAPEPAPPPEEKESVETDGIGHFEIDSEAMEPLGGREMVINVSAGDECRAAILQDGRLEELFIERASSQSHVGNIYKGRVTNVEPSIQAAFLDFGMPKNGFLHISDVQPQYFPNHRGEAEDVGRKIPRHSRPPIQKCFRRGQEAIVQITKEGVGTKGPTLTTYLSIPGRFLVMMPGMSHHGVSRKIVDEEDRREMRDLLNELTLPSEMGFILRTAGLGRSKRELQRDLNYLMRLWKTVSGRIKRLTAPAALYQESDLVTRTIRDVYTSDFKRVIVDDAVTAKKAREFLQIAMPRSKPVVELYSEREPLFYRLGIEQEIERINMRQVPLPSGGSLVIDTTEALVAIDVNSGRFRTPEDAEETAFQINLEAAEEIARQLRLRDLGGLIVCDFIDMRGDRHKREVERALREALKKHKERARILRMSQFGLIEMTRQRQGPSLKRNIYYDCPHCRGSGLVKMPESVILDVMRMIQLAAHNVDVQRVTVTVASSVAFDILNRKRAVLNEIEAETDKEILIRGDAAFTSDQIECLCEDTYGRPVTLGRNDSAEPPPAKPNREGRKPDGGVIQSGGP